MSDSRKLIREITDANGEKKNIIHLTKDGIKADVFEIVYNKTGSKKANSGSDCICYDAVLLSDSSRSGKLKEFYPLPADNDENLLKRRSDNILCPPETIRSYVEKFNQAKDEFIRSHKTLRNIMEQSEELKQFIPDFTLYYSCNPDGTTEKNGTVYVWTPGIPMQTFDEYLKDVRENVSTNPTHKLFVILNTILNLTECIDLMHAAGLLHLDIKPSNFGFEMRKNTPMYSSISLFDVNSFIQSGTVPPYIKGTEEYSALQSALRPGKKSDIYSIGATLFEAVVIHDSIKSRGFKREWYTGIREYVKESKLICASAHNSNIFLVDTLCDILWSCLDDFEHGRPDTKELIRMLKKAINCLIPAEYALSQDVRKLMSENEIHKLAKIIDKNSTRNTKLILQQHLYEHPLYEYTKRAKSLSGKNPDNSILKLNIVVAGFGNFGQCFTDTALPLSMMHNTEVSFYVLSASPSDKELYLRQRTALKDFFNIGSEKLQDKYGSIHFEEINCNPDENPDIADYIAKLNPCYVFAALGNDELNTAFVNSLYGIQNNCSLNFTYESDRFDSSKLSVRATAVNENCKPEKSSKYKTLENMAFNCHMLWNRNYNESPLEIRRKFLKAYNHSACIANAVSVKYKLAGLGIYDSSPIRAAAAYSEIIGNTTIKNSLTACEQHRWATDKICSEGYTRLENMDEAVKITASTGNTYDKAEKKHICLVKTSTSKKLTASSDWDKSPDKDFDELEKVSVNYHRAMKKYAQSMRSKNPLASSYVKRLRELSKPFPEAVRAFEDWFRIMVLISDGKTDFIRKYNDAKSNFADILKKSLSVKDLHEAKANINGLNSMFYPICLSLVRKNFKDNDEDIITHLPYILTFRNRTVLTVPLLYGKEDNPADNIAQAAVINPVKILYLCRITNASEIPEILSAMEFVCHVANSKHLGGRITLLAECDDDLYEKAEILHSLKKHRHMSSVRICGINKSTAYLNKYINSEKGNILADKNKNYSKFLMPQSLLGKIPCFSFDSEKRIFTDICRCDFLKYANTDISLRTSDIPGLKLSEKNSLCRLLDFSENSGIFDIYTKYPDIWQDLCKMLSEYTEKHDILAFFPFNSDGNIEYENMCFTLPSFAFECVESIISEAKNAKILPESAEVDFSASPNSFKVSFKADRTHIPFFRKLFANPGNLANISCIKCQNNSNGFSVYRNDLVVTELCKDKDSATSELTAVLKALEEMNMIYNLYISTSGKDISCSFVFCSEYSKELLTDGNFISEQYCFSKLALSNCFDDVASVLIPDSEYSGDKTYIAVTKGFRLILIKCDTTIKRQEETSLQNGIVVLTKKDDILNITAVADKLLNTQI